MASFESRDQRIGSSISPPSTHQAFPNQLNRVSSLAQHSLQQIPVDNAILPPSHVLAPQFHSCLGSRSQKLLEASALSFYGRRTLESLAGSIQSNIASLGTGSNIISPPQYTGIQGDQNFSTSSALFPAFDVTVVSLGYLPAAAGAVGATYNPSCNAPDGSFCGHLEMPSSVDIASCTEQQPTNFAVEIPDGDTDTVEC
ncbi:hypothetical protein CCACVL1_09424 [Corchorus capsularis]|uniref:Uncharacterized protein n=1 Tax=Corchorus capsularis TaxID=210143 RepID=A0A1R3IWE4_COCAP|nr:hypothetical protein CCACVL1_09424 [Corchorus capsularis]